MCMPPVARLTRAVILIVFFLRKPDHFALILSARDMDQKERRRYERT